MHRQSLLCSFREDRLCEKNGNGFFHKVSTQCNICIWTGTHTMLLILMHQFNPCYMHHWTHKSRFFFRKWNCKTFVVQWPKCVELYPWVLSRNTEEREDVVPVLKAFRTQAILGNSEQKGTTHQKDEKSEACRGKMTFLRLQSYVMELFRWKPGVQKLEPNATLFCTSPLQHPCWDRTNAVPDLKVSGGWPMFLGIWLPPWDSWEAPLLGLSDCSPYHGHHTLFFQLASPFSPWFWDWGERLGAGVLYPDPHCGIHTLSKKSSWARLHTAPYLINTTPFDSESPLLGISTREMCTYVY